MGDARSLAHTRWNCKYHIVFTAKYQRQVFHGEKKAAAGKILHKSCPGSPFTEHPIDPKKTCPGRLAMVDEHRVRVASENQKNGNLLVAFLLVSSLAVSVFAGVVRLL